MKPFLDEQPPRRMVITGLEGFTNARRSEMLMLMEVLVHAQATLRRPRRVVSHRV